MVIFLPEKTFIKFLILEVEKTIDEVLRDHQENIYVCCCFSFSPDNRPIFWPQNNLAHIQEPGAHPHQQRQQQNQISRPVPRQVLVNHQQPMQHYAPPPAQPQYATPLARLQNINTPQIMHPLNGAAGISRPSLFLQYEEENEMVLLHLGGLLNNNAYMIVTAQSSRKF